MKEKIQDTLEMRWAPAISTMIINMIVVLTAFNWMIGRIDQQGERTDQQGARTDKLYEMFVQLLKEQKNKDV